MSASAVEIGLPEGSRRGCELDEEGVEVDVEIVVNKSGVKVIGVDGKG